MNATHTPWPMKVEHIPGYHQISIAPHDMASLRLVTYRNEAGSYGGDVAIFMGKHAEGDANLFVSAAGLLAAITNAIEELDPYMQPNRIRNLRDALIVARSKATGQAVPE